MSTPTAERSPGPLSHPYTTVSVVILMLVTIVAFESMAVSTAMPRVAMELNAVRGYGFAFSAMMTAQLTGIVLAGEWSDRSGPLPGTFGGQLLVGLGSLVCALAGRFDLFLLGRVLTGLGGGVLVVMLYVIVGRVFPETLRPKLFVYISAAWVLPSLLGPVIAVWLTVHASWRWVFGIVVIPVVLTMAGMMYAARGFDTTDLRQATSSRDHSTHVRVAWAGIAIALAAGAVQFGTHELQARWSAKTIIAVIGVVGVVLVAPKLVPPGTWRMAAGLPSVMLARALYTASFYGALAYVPLFLNGQRHAPLRVAGLAVACSALGWAFGSWWQGRESLTMHRAQLVTLGGTLLTISIGLLALIAAANLRGWLCAPALVVGGIAMGMGVTSTTVLALELSPVEDHGANSSSLQLADVLGSVLGIAAVTAIFAAGHVPGRDNHLFGVIFLVLAVIAAFAIPAGQRIKR